MRNRKQNNFNIKDYIVPIITFILIFTLIYIAIWWDSEEKENNNSNNKNEVSTNIENNNELNIIFWNEKTKVDIIKVDKEKKPAINNSKLQSGEVVVVNKWYISSNLSDTTKISLNWDKWTWRMKYISNSSIELIASSLWINTTSPINVKLKFGSVKLWANSIVNLRQTEATTSAYLIKWSLEFISKSSSTFLSPWKKIEIWYKEFSKDDIDLNILKNDFDDHFRIRDWTVQNNWWTPLTNLDISINSQNNDNILSNTWVIDEVKNKVTTSNTLLNFDWIYDEGFVNTNKTNISWNFIDENISSITINWKSANINMEKKTFNVIWVNTNNKVNDLIIKVFNNSNDLIWKSILTLNYKAGSNENNTNLFSEINTESYPVNKSDFVVSIPTVKQWKTFSSENTFYGTVKNPNVAVVKVNWYKLKTYNWKTFRYHAYTRFKTLWEWVNNYKIEYIWKDWKTILVQYETIEKLSKKAISKKIISSEAQ